MHLTDTITGTVAEFEELISIKNSMEDFDNNKETERSLTEMDCDDAKIISRDSQEDLGRSEVKKDDTEEKSTQGGIPLVNRFINLFFFLIFAPY